MEENTNVTEHNEPQMTAAKVIALQYPKNQGFGPEYFETNGFYPVKNASGHPIENVQVEVHPSKKEAGGFWWKVILKVQGIDRVFEKFGPVIMGEESCKLDLDAAKFVAVIEERLGKVALFKAGEKVR